MNKREKILAAMVAALVLLIAGNHYYGRYTKVLSARQADLQTARTNLEVAKQKLKDGHIAVEQLEAAQQRSLPGNYEKASSLYKDWLLTKAKDAGLAVSDIKATLSSSTSPAFKGISYQIVAGGSLSNVTSMLYEFYKSPQLHQITRLQLTRPPGSQQLQVTLDVEALSMRGAVATDKLPEGDSKRLKLASADEYKKSLDERDIVTAYSPPRPPAPPQERKATAGPPKFDESEQARFTAAVNSDKGMQAWIYVKPTGEILHVTAGDPVKIGALEGQIESVEARSLVLKSGDKRFRVQLGEYIRKGKEIDVAGDVKPSPPAEPPKS